MHRRRAIKVLSLPLLSPCLALQGCGAEKPAARPAAHPFSEASLLSKLDAMRAAVEARNPNTTAGLQPGLTDAQIRDQTLWFKPGLPRELQTLYRWRNGYRDTGADRTPPFWFRDYVFSPIEQAEKAYEGMMSTYGADPASHALLADAFPFASLGGGWLVAPTTPRSVAPGLERPILSVFQGISVFFHSIESMVETCTAWVSHPASDGFGLPPKIEMEIWRRFNPGIFES